METIGDRIRKLRNYAGISQKKLADKLKISEKTLRRYEQDINIPDVYAVVALASYFDVTVDYLVGAGGLKKILLEDKKVDLTKEMSKRYLECREEYTIDDAFYYWITSENDGKKIGGQTERVGFTETSPKKNIVKLRYINPNEAIDLCTKLYGKPMVINKKEDVGVFLIYGGHAIIREDICESELPWFLKPFVLE